MARNFGAAQATDRVTWTGGNLWYNQTSATVMCWFKHATIVAGGSGANNAFVFDFQSAFNIRVFTFMDDATGKFNCSWRTPTGNASFNSTNRWDDNKWHTFVLVRRNSSPFLELYVDGTSEGSSTTDPGTNSTASGGQEWGNNVQGGNTSSWSGDLARCAFITGTALNVNEATSFLYTGKSSRKLDQWLELGYTSPEIDVSGNGLSGTLTNTTNSANPPYSYFGSLGGWLGAFTGATPSTSTGPAGNRLMLMGVGT